jgi:hypothetical protein
MIFFLGLTVAQELNHLFWERKCPRYRIFPTFLHPHIKPQSCKGFFFSSPSASSVIPALELEGRAVRVSRWTEPQTTLTGPEEPPGVGFPMSVLLSLSGVVPSGRALSHGCLASGFTFRRGVCLSGVPKQLAGHGMHASLVVRIVGLFPLLSERHCVV